jgi:hypothetical protein
MLATVMKEKREKIIHAQKLEGEKVVLNNKINDFKDEISRFDLKNQDNKDQIKTLREHNEEIKAKLHQQT